MVNPVIGYRELLKQAVDKELEKEKRRFLFFRMHKNKAYMIKSMITEGIEYGLYDEMMKCEREDKIAEEIVKEFQIILECITVNGDMGKATKRVL